jgi:hypothetical protein
MDNIHNDDTDTDNDYNNDDKDNNDENSVLGVLNTFFIFLLYT